MRITLIRLTRLSLLATALVIGSSADATAQAPGPKLDAVLAQRATRNLAGRSRVLVEFRGDTDVRVLGGTGQAHRKIGSRILVGHVDNHVLTTMAADTRVTRVMVDRPTFPTNERVGIATGATASKLEYRLTGKGVGVAIIDSGVAAYHDDLMRTRLGLSPRVAHYKDFTQITSANVTVSTLPSDEYGHGTHVAGIIAGTGYDSRGARAGVAPGAKLVALKVLDAQGQGFVSDAIAAIDYAVAVKNTYNIRVINLSVAAGVFESYANDPLALAARRAVNAGIIVVAAAGNLGENSEGETQFGGITSPGNAPWVLTVGAASGQGSGTRGDDKVARFSSRGPTWINFSAKPDLVAYGVGIESLAAPMSTLYQELSAYLLSGLLPTASKPYLSLTGTSMAAPVVSGTIALMLEANPSLTPNAVKALLQYSSEVIPDAHALSQGAGLLNSRGAIRLAKFFKQPTSTLPAPFDLIGNERIDWAKSMVWGNYRVTGGVPLPGSNAWALNQPWGALETPAGGSVIWGADEDANIVWSTQSDGNIVWSTSDNDGNIVWSTDEDSNIVWSTGDAGDDANIVWSTDADGNIVWSTIDDQDSNIVWSTAVAQNVVWGNDCGGHDCPRIVWGALRPHGGGVWGTLDDDGNIVWSTSDDGNIVWSTNDDGNIVWSTNEIDSNIVWSTSDDANIVWSTDADGNIVWSTSDDGNIVWSTNDDANIVWATRLSRQQLWRAGQ